MAKVREFKEIPRAKIDTGIDLCKKNIEVFLDTAQILLKNGNLNHAAINVEFAIEEYAKILMIKDAYKANSDPVKVDMNAFRHHLKKSERAWKANNSDALELQYKMISEGGFERSDNGKIGFSRGYAQAIYISHYIRCECAFVDFDDGQWHVGHSKITKERLQNLIDHVNEKTKGISLT